MLTKLADYQAAIPYIWLIDPYKRALFESIDGRLRRPEGQVVSTPLVGELDFGPHSRNSTKLRNNRVRKLARRSLTADVAG